MSLSHRSVPNRWTTAVFSVFVALAFGLSCAGKATPPAAPPADPLASATASTTQPANAADPPLPLDPAAKVATLPNGIRTYIRKHSEPQKRASLRLVINAGSVLEDEKERGLAHFVEHMAFNGTRLFAKQEIVNFIESAGMRFGQHANAFTSFDETGYTFEVPTTDPALLEKAFSMMQQMAAEVSFDPEEVNRERGVVIEEWRLGLGAQMRVLEQLFPVLFAKSRYAERLPIGKKEVLEKATADDLRGFYKRWYRPDLMAVIAVGDFDIATVQAHIQKFFAPIAPVPNAAPRVLYPVPDHNETLVSIAKDKELTSTSAGIIYKLPTRGQSSKRDYRRSVVERIYHSMVNARLEELSRDKDPPFLGAGSGTQSFVRTKDVFLQFAATKADGVPRALQALTREIERVDRHGFTAGELDREKAAFLRFMERAVLEKDKSPSALYADEMMRNYLEGEAMPGIDSELALVKEFLPTITLAEMNKVASEWITEKSRVLTVQAPEAAVVPSPDELRALFAKTEGAEIGPYVDRVTTAPLFNNLPKPGKVVKESTIPEIGVTEWRLSNGIRVILKPTDFKNDEVLMHGRSPGGHSRTPDKDYESATFAAGVIDGSGVADIGPTELRKALAGKVVTVRPYISELEEGVSGSASPNDLETLLGLTYLTITAPRRDEQVFEAFRAQLRESLLRRQADPSAVFADKWTRLYYKNHPRRRPPELAMADRISLDAMMRVYKDRFAEAGDFTFVLVGRIDLAKVKPLVEQYLATLPTKGRKETFRDIGIRPIGGVQTLNVALGQEPKTQVRMTFNGESRYDEVSEHRLKSLGEALSIRMREVLREDLGGTYTVGVGGSLIRQPRETYRSEVNFTCAPENRAKLIEAVNTELAAAREKGPAAVYIDKVKIAQRRILEEDLRNNGHWMSELASHARYGTDPRRILEEGKLIESLDAAGLATAAKKYFDPRRVLIATLEPAVAGQNKPADKPTDKPTDKPAAPANKPSSKGATPGAPTGKAPAPAPTPGAASAPQ
jgi:zinc protease